MRERGLKLKGSAGSGKSVSRSREGAWIEIYSYTRQAFINDGRSREGAWIEITLLSAKTAMLESLP